MLFGDVHAVEEEPRLRSGDAADDVAVHDLGRTGCVFPVGGSSATPDVSRASS